MFNDNSTDCELKGVELNAYWVQLKKAAQGNPKLLTFFNPCGSLRLTDSLRQEIRYHRRIVQSRIKIGRLLFVDNFSF